MRKTILGVMLATFLVLSISFIAPVQVQAAETNLKQTKRDIGNLASSITGNDKYEELRDNSELKNIIQNIINNGATQERITDYWNEINNLEAFNEICTDDSLADAESIYNAIDIFLQGSSDSEEDGFYVGVNDENSLSVKKEFETNTVFIDNEGNLRIPGHGTIAGDLMDNIKEALIMLFLIGAGAAVGVLVIAGVFLLLQAIIAAIASALGTIATTVIAVAIVFAVIAGISMVITFIIDVIEFLTGSKDATRKAKSAENNLRRMLHSKLVSILNKFFNLFNMKL